MNVRGTFKRMNRKRRGCLKKAFLDERFLKDNSPINIWLFFDKQKVLLQGAVSSQDFYFFKVHRHSVG